MEIGKALLGEVITKDCQDEKNQDVQSIANLRKSPTCPALRAGLFSQACGFSVLRVWSRKSWPPHLQGCEVRMEHSPIPARTGVLCGTVLDCKRVEVWSMWLCQRKRQIKIIKFEIARSRHFSEFRTQLPNQISSGNSRLKPGILWTYHQASMDRSISGSSVAYGCDSCELSTPICWILATPIFGILYLPAFVVVSYGGTLLRKQHWGDVSHDITGIHLAWRQSP